MTNLPVHVPGSDGNIYTITFERVGYGKTELSLIPIKIRVDTDSSTIVDLPKQVVERYIEQTKAKYNPSIYKVSELKHLLNVTQINNHFDYLALLHKVNPILDEFLQ